MSIWSANSAGYDQAALGQHCLLRNVCSNNLGKSGTLYLFYHLTFFFLICHDYVRGKAVPCKLYNSAPIITAKDILIFFSFFVFQRKQVLAFHVNPSASRQIHMKCQDLFSLKNNFFPVIWPSDLVFDPE